MLVYLKKIPIESLLKEIKPVVSELFEIENRNKLVSQLFPQTLDEQELDTYFKIIILT